MLAHVLTLGDAVNLLQKRPPRKGTLASKRHFRGMLEQSDMQHAGDDLFASPTAAAELSKGILDTDKKHKENVSGAATSAESCDSKDSNTTTEQPRASRSKRRASSNSTQADSEDAAQSSSASARSPSVDMKSPSPIKAAPSAVVSRSSRQKKPPERFVDQRFVGSYENKARRASQSKERESEEFFKPVCDYF